MTKNTPLGQGADALEYQVEELSSTLRVTQIELHRALEALETQRAELETFKA